MKLEDYKRILHQVTASSKSRSNSVTPAFFAEAKSSGGEVDSQFLKIVSSHFHGSSTEVSARDGHYVISIPESMFISKRNDVTVMEKSLRKIGYTNTSGDWNIDSMGSDMVAAFAKER
jgi:hypothetical protein